MEIKENSHNSKPVISVKSKDGEIINVFRIEKKDAWGMCDYITANEDRLRLYFPKTSTANLTPDLSKRFVEIKSKEFDNKEEFLYTLKPQNSNKIIGVFYIKELLWDILQGELAYSIDYNYERKGIVSKIVNKMSEYAFSDLGLKTLQIFAHKTNLPSVRVAEKGGFVWVETQIGKYTPKNGTPMDMELYERYKN